MPWTILNLEPEGASERDVKRAYARLLKQHRPEEDPEGFQRIHAAYQQALNELQWATEYNDENQPPVIRFDSNAERLDAPSDPEQLATTEHTEQELPPSKRGDYHEVVLEPDLPFDQPSPDLPFGQPSLPILEPADLKAPPALPPPKPIVPKNVNIKEVLAALEAGHDKMPMRVLDKVQLRDLSNIRPKLAHAMLAEPARFANEESTTFARRLAMLIAFRNPHLSERLLDMLYQNLAPSEREYALAAPMWLLAAAPEFKAVINSRHWDFWCAAFTDPDSINWDSTLAGFALGEADRLGHWEGYEGLDQIVPVEKQLWNQRAPQPQRIHRAQPAKRTTDPKLSAGAIIALLWLAFMAAKAFLPLIDTEEGVNFGPAPQTTQTEPGWSKQADLTPVFMDAESQEAFHIKDGTVQILTKRTEQGEPVHFVAHGQYVREFNSAQLQQWRNRHRLGQSASSTVPLRSNEQRDQFRQRQKAAERIAENMREGNQPLITPAPRVPNSPSNFRSPTTTNPLHPGMRGTQPSGRVHAPGIPRSPSRGPTTPFRPPSVPNPGW